MKWIIVLIVFVCLTWKCNSKTNNETQFSTDSLSIENEKFINSTNLQYDKFALIFPNDQYLYMWGKFKLNDSVKILDFINKKIFDAKTVKYSVSPSDDFFEQSVLTQLESNFAKTSEFNNGSIIVRNNRNTINFIEKQEINNDSLYSKINGLVKKIDISELYSGFDSYDTTYLNEKPIVEKISFNNETYLIVTYCRPNDNSSIGPRFIIFPDNKIFSISGPCSSPIISFFSIGNNIHIYSVSWCCGCGQINYTIKKINGYNLEIIYENSDFST